MKLAVFVVAALALTLGALAGELGEHPEASTGARPLSARSGIHKIKHVVVIMQGEQILRLLLRNLSRR